MAADEAPQTFEQYLSRVPEDEHERLHRMFARAVTGELNEDVEHTFLRGDGELRHLVVKVSPVRNGASEVVGYRGALLDVTERRRLEEQLRQAQKMEAIGQLTAGIAHNFNNLLGVIIPNIALCRQSAAEHLLPGLTDVAMAAERAADLVRQLMLFARPTTPGRRTNVDVVTAARRTVEMCRTAFGQKLSLRLEADVDLPCVAGNAGHLEQVVLNLCLNARDALVDAGVPRGEIVVRIARRDGAWVRLEVQDNGPGMDESVRARVFEPFFTTKGVGRGTGLGLASVYAIVADHGGRIRCESRPGEGARFIVELPATTGTSEPPPPPQSRRARRERPTILLVDDEPLVRRVLRLLLEREGYEVLEAADGPSAVTAFSEAPERFDLVLLDQSMPGLSGDQVLSRIRQVDEGVRVVVVSGHPGDLSRTDVTAVLMKPIDPPSFLAAVRGALER